MHSIQRTKNYLRTFTCLSATYRSSVLCGIRSTRFCRRCMPPDVPMSTTPGKEPNCFKMVSSLTDKNAATSETVSIRGSTLSAALIPPALTGALRLMEDIPAASPTTMSFSSSRSVTRPGPLRSVTFISAIGGLRGVVPAISSHPIPGETFFKDEADRITRPILSDYGRFSTAIVCDYGLSSELFACWRPPAC
jgi:hypothetical protein